MNTEACKSGPTGRKRHLFLTRAANNEAQMSAIKLLRDIGAKVISSYGPGAIVADANENEISAAHGSCMFLGIYCGAIHKEHLEKLPKGHLDAVTLWNHKHSKAYRKVAKDYTNLGKSWGDKGFKAPAPSAPISPEDFRDALSRHLDLSEKELIAKYAKGARDEKLKPIDPTDLGKWEGRLREQFKDPTVSYHLVRILLYLPPIYQVVLFKIPLDIILAIFQEPSCWKMENEISVGVIFVESSRSGGPKFTSSQRNTIRARIADGLDWLAGEAPTLAHLSWAYDWQYTSVDVADKTPTASDTYETLESYWRDPGMGEVNFNGTSYASNLTGVGDYRSDLRIQNISSHAFVIFVTPFTTKWPAYRTGTRFILSDTDNWAGWGMNNLDKIVSHEACHIFGAADEYTGSGTPCSSCTTLHGCYQIPNGNCGTCAKPQQNCIMDDNDWRICAYTQGQVGWADLFVELTTADATWAGTDDTVWLDIGDRTFVLDTPNHNDRERDNVEGYALNYTGLTKSDIKRVGIRKSSDGVSGGWKLKRVRLWCRGELVCDRNNINQWLEDEYRWWASTSCGSSSTIVNTLRVKVRTADVTWAGTDDTVTFYMGGRSWELDNPWHNDFERNNTDTFDLDPGTSLYTSSLSSLRIHKSPDGIGGGWKLRGLEVIVNGSTIYNNQSINKWLEDDDRNWYGTI